MLFVDGNITGVLEAMATRTSLVREVALEIRNLDHCTLKSRGGLPRVLALFGKDGLPTLLEELTTAFAA